MQEKLNKALKQIKKILNNQFFLSGGQVLGAIREKKFLDNEHDIDLGIFSQDAKKIIKILKDKDLLDNNSIRKINRTNIIRVVKFELNGVKIDLFVHYLIRDKWYGITYDDTLGYAFHGYPREIHDNLKEIELFGEKYKSPDPILYLECEYGNWRKKVNKWSCCLNPPCLEKKVYIGGVFDLFHVGHLRLIERARKCGGILIAGVITDKAAEIYKRKPFIPYKERAKIVNKLVDIVVPQYDVDAIKFGLIPLFNPDIIVHGDDHIPHSYNWAIMNNKKTIMCPYTKYQSTTKIIEKIKGKKWIINLE